MSARKTLASIDIPACAVFSYRDPLSGVEELNTELERFGIELVVINDGSSELCVFPRRIEKDPA